jgi:phosphatidylethanolamine/phosphatidyl-N-methylethanolamine N-methyltransferase
MTGSVAPSSSTLAREIVRGLNLGVSEAVLEYGPGTGAFTNRILDEIPQSCRFVAIERNPKFAELLRDKFPAVNLCHGDVADVRKICDDYHISMADCIISGLPWAAFALQTQQAYMHEMMRVLRPGGYFVTFMLTTSLLVPSSWRFAKMLKRHFSKVEVSGIVWRNFPPAFIYRCRR